MFSARVEGSVSMPVLRSLWLLPLRVMASARWTLRSIVAAAASLVAGDVAPAGEGQLRVRISRACS